MCKFALKNLTGMSRILIVDDDSSIVLSLSMLLRRARYTCVKAGGEAEALARIREALKGGTTDDIDLILMDMNYTSDTSGRDGLELLQKVKVLMPRVPVILMTAWGSIPLAVEGVKLGAMDFVTKPWDNRDLLSRVATALSLNADTPASTDTGDAFDGIIGNSPALMAVLDKVRKAAPTDAAILITGENGTGKELIARAIHRMSRRSDSPFVTVNLGGMPPTLFESEMFGYAKGAFTGADSDRTGRFEAADKGTIFLDEIGDLDTSCQVKILRVLQEHTFERLGESTPRKIDIRVVCATNVDLPAAVAQGRFREDLFYRINLITLRMPPLRERPDDIPLLVRHFAGPEVEFSPDAMQLLSSLPYPGNIRELKNLVSRLTIISDSPRITAAEIRRSIDIAPATRPAVSDKAATVTLTLDELEKKAITEALDRFGGNLSQAAASLGITRQSLYRRMEKFGIPQ